MELHKKGIWFQSAKPGCQWHLICFEVKTPEHNVLATIYRVNSLPGDANYENGQEVEIAYPDCDDFMTIDLWNKYYFLEFTGRNQWYYDSAEPDGTAEVMNFSIKEGLKIGNIYTY